jgi:hypothetical protein
LHGNVRQLLSLKAFTSVGEEILADRQIGKEIFTGGARLAFAAQTGMLFQQLDRDTSDHPTGAVADGSGDAAECLLCNRQWSEKRGDCHKCS